MTYPELPRYFVDALGIRTGYYMAGEPHGRPVVLLHGMSTSADSFREIMHELAADYWLIAPDIPGFGYSDNTAPYTVPHLVEWLASFKEALQLPLVRLLGHSFGAVLATAFATFYPEDVGRLLLVAPAILHQENYPDLLKKVGISSGLLDLGSAVSQSSLLINYQVRTAFYDAGKQPESLWERRLRDYELSRASASVLKALAFYSLRPYLDKIEDPVCIVWGQDDPVVPVSDAGLLAELIPDASVRILSHCGHVPMLEQRQQFLSIARDFLAPD